MRLFKKLDLKWGLMSTATHELAMEKQASSFERKIRILEREGLNFYIDTNYAEGIQRAIVSQGISMNVLERYKGRRLEIINDTAEDIAIRLKVFLLKELK
jgi:hypothetical protein